MGPIDVLFIFGDGMIPTLVSVAAGLGLLPVTPAQAGGVLQMALLFVVVVGILVFVHELGHFLVAKRAGVGVLKFSLGFGPKVFGFRRGETEYLVSAIPLGGYVKMIGEDPADRTADPQKSFQNKSVGWRSLVVLAGPGSNVLLAVLLFMGVFLVLGQPVKAPVVGDVEAGSAAERAGLRPGDRVVAVGGAPVTQWDQVLDRVDESEGRPLPVQVERGGDRLALTVTPQRQRREVQAVGPKVGRVEAGSPADRAGVRAGDKVVAFDGASIGLWEDLVRLVHKSPGRTGRLTVERNGQRLELEVTPIAVPNPAGTGQIGRIGVEVDLAQEPLRLERDEWILGARQRFESIPLHRAAGLGIQKTWDVGFQTVWILGRLLKGEISPKTIGGPLYIAREASRQADQGGLLSVVLLTAVLSVNLAILNILPVPILDGGHLLFFAIEGLRGGPVSLRKREIAQQVGLALLIALMVFAFYNDIFRILGRP